MPSSYLVAFLNLIGFLKKEKPALIKCIKAGCLHENVQSDEYQVVDSVYLK